MYFEIAEGQITRRYLAFRDLWANPVPNKLEKPRQMFGKIL